MEGLTQPNALFVGAGGTFLSKDAHLQREDASVSLCVFIKQEKNRWEWWIEPHSRPVAMASIWLRAKTDQAWRDWREVDLAFFLLLLCI